MSEIISAVWASLPGWGRAGAAIAAVVAAAVLAGLVLRAARSGVPAAVRAARAGAKRMFTKERRGMLRQLSGPAVLAVAVLYLVLDGLLAFATEQADIQSPGGRYLVIVAVEFTAIYLFFERYAYADRGRHDRAFLVFGEWVLLGLGAFLQASHALVDDDIDPFGAVFRAALPLILGLLGEWVVRARRQDRHEDAEEEAGRVIPRSLRWRPVERAAVRRELDTHPDWSASQAMIRVRSERLAGVLWRLRDLVKAAPDEPVRPPVPAAPGAEAPRSAHRRHRVAVRRADKAYRRQLRSRKKWEAEVARLRRRAVALAGPLGIIGAPEDPAADLLGGLQARALLSELETAALDAGRAVDLVRQIVTASQIQAARAADAPAGAADGGGAAGPGIDVSIETGAESRPGPVESSGTGAGVSIPGLDSEGRNPASAPAGAEGGAAGIETTTAEGTFPVETPVPTLDTGIETPVDSRPVSIESFETPAESAGGSRPGIDRAASATLDSGIESRGPGIDSAPAGAAASEEAQVGPVSTGLDSGTGPVSEAERGRLPGLADTLAVVRERMRAEEEAAPADDGGPSPVETPAPTLDTGIETSADSRPGTVENSETGGPLSIETPPPGIETGPVSIESSAPGLDSDAPPRPEPAPALDTGPAEEDPDDDPDGPDGPGGGGAPAPRPEEAPRSADGAVFAAVVPVPEVERVYAEIAAARRPALADTALASKVEICTAWLWDTRGDTAEVRRMWRAEFGAEAEAPNDLYTYHDKWQAVLIKGLLDHFKDPADARGAMAELGQKKIKRRAKEALADWTTGQEGVIPFRRGGSGGQ